MGLGGTLLARMMTALNALRATTVQEELFVLGKAFSYEDYHTFGAAEVKNFVFDPTSFTGVNLTVNPFLFGATGGPVRIDIYYGTIANDDGTLLGISNRRFGFPAPESVLRLNPTGFTAGTRFAGDLVPGTGLNPATSNPSGNQAGLPFEINPDLKYALVATNDDGAGVVWQIKMTFFEV